MNRPTSHPASRPPGRDPRRRLAGWLAACVTAIVYVTLYPWSGWHAPGVPVFAFLSEPWPRYWTRLDVLMNVVAYVPLGLIATALFSRRLPIALAALTAIAAAALLSCGLEALQTLLPSRVASLLDLIANTAGAAIGAAAAAPIGARRVEGWSIVAARTLPLAPGATMGIVLLALWIVLQWHPQPVAFASGELMPLLGLLVPDSQHWFATIRLAPEHEPAADAIAIAATVAAVGLIARELLRVRAPSWLLGVPVLLAAAVKSVATGSLLGVRNSLAWLSAATQGGLIAGVLVLALIFWWRPRPRLLAAALALACASLLYNLSPPSVYFEATFANWNQGQWANVNGLLRALALVWPYLAIGWCLARLRRVPPHHPIIKRS